MATRIVVLVAVGVLVAVAAILILAATKPDSFRIERSVTIQASAEKIFPLINDFHNWSQWAPQDREDPSIKRTYSGPASGVGAVSEWSSSGKAGSGTMSITESAPGSRVVIDVHFVKPFAAHNVNVFTLEPGGNGDQGDVEHGGHESLLHEADERLFEHGPDDGRPLRERAAGPEGGGGEMSPGAIKGL